MTEATGIARPETVSRAIRRITAPAVSLRQALRRLDASYEAKMERATTEYIEAVRELTTSAFAADTAQPEEPSATEGAAF